MLCSSIILHLMFWERISHWTCSLLFWQPWLNSKSLESACLCTLLPVLGLQLICTYCRPEIRSLLYPLSHLSSPRWQHIPYHFLPIEEFGNRCQKSLKCLGAIKLSSKNRPRYVKSYVKETESYYDSKVLVK